MATEKRLIDAHELIDLIKKNAPYLYHMVATIICLCPAVDAVEVVHGQTERSGTTAPTAVQKWMEVIPMLTDDNPNIMELCFHNGEAHMKEKVISMLQGVADSMSCITLAQVIKMVEGL